MYTFLVWFVHKLICFNFWPVPPETHMQVWISQRCQKVWISQRWQKSWQRMSFCHFWFLNCFYQRFSVVVWAEKYFPVQNWKNSMFWYVLTHLYEICQKVFLVKFLVTFDQSTPACVSERGPAKSWNKSISAQSTLRCGLHLIFDFSQIFLLFRVPWCPTEDLFLNIWL